MIDQVKPYSPEIEIPAPLQELNEKRARFIAKNCPENGYDVEGLTEYFSSIDADLEEYLKKEGVPEFLKSTLRTHLILPYEQSMEYGQLLNGLRYAIPKDDDIEVPHLEAMNHLVGIRSFLAAYAIKRGRRSESYDMLQKSIKNIIISGKNSKRILRVDRPGTPVHLRATFDLLDDKRDEVAQALEIRPESKLMEGDDKLLAEFLLGDMPVNDRFSVV